MRITTILILALMMTTSAFANRNRVERRILRQVQSIEENLAFSSANTEELRQALRLLRQAKKIISGDTRDRQPVPSIRLECTDRDGDDRAPYVFSYIKGFNVIKLKNVTFHSLSNCQRSLDESFFVQGVQTMCVARDGDNRAPYSLVTVRGQQLTKITSKSFPSYSKCRDIERRSVSRSDGLFFCIDRDSDNRAPYVIRKFNALNNSVENVNSQTFSSIEKCERVLFR